MDASIIELPLNMQHNISIRGKYCITDMMLNQEGYDRFSLLHYFSLICCEKDDDIEYLDYDAPGSFFEDEGVIAIETCNFPKVNIPFRSVDIVAYLCELIRHAKYIKLFFDDYYNSASPYFEKKHAICEYLLYGYRKDDAVFIAYGSLGEDPMCSSVDIKFDDIKKAFAETDFMFYLIEKEKYTPSEPTTEQLLSLVKRYLCSSYDNTTNVQHGIIATKTAISALPKLSERKKITFLYRIVEFEQIFALRLEALCDKGILPQSFVSEHGLLLSDYSDAVEQWYTQDRETTDSVLSVLDKLISFEDTELKNALMEL